MKRQKSPVPLWLPVALAAFLGGSIAFALFGAVFLPYLRSPSAPSVSGRSTSEERPRIKREVIDYELIKRFEEADEVGKIRGRAEHKDTLALDALDLCQVFALNSDERLVRDRNLRVTGALVGKFRDRDGRLLALLAGPTDWEVRAYPIRSQESELDGVSAGDLIEIFGVIVDQKDKTVRLGGCWVIKQNSVPERFLERASGASAKQLAIWLRTNSAAYREKFQGKYVSVHGTVQRVDYSSGGGELELEAPNGTTVACAMNDDGARRVSPGDFVIVRGTARLQDHCATIEGATLVAAR